MTRAVLRRVSVHTIGSTCASLEGKHSILLGSENGGNSVSFYWNDNDRKDQEFRREINAGKTTYTDSASCDWCGDRLQGSSFECAVCNALLCNLCICVDGRCPEHTVRED